MGKLLKDDTGLRIVDALRRMNNAGVIAYNDDSGNVTLTPFNKDLSEVETEKLELQLNLENKANKTYVDDLILKLLVGGQLSAVVTERDLIWTYKYNGTSQAGFYATLTSNLLKNSTISSVYYDCQISGINLLDNNVILSTNFSTGGNPTLTTEETLQNVSLAVLSDNPEELDTKSISSIVTIKAIIPVNIRGLSTTESSVSDILNTIRNVHEIAITTLQEQTSSLQNQLNLVDPVDSSNSSFVLNPSETNGALIGDGWIRFNDGTQICYGANHMDMTTSTKITFPVPFAGGNGYGLAVQNAGMTGTTAWGNSSFTIQRSAAATDSWYNYLAVGRWKL